MTTTATTLPMVLAEVEVAATRRLSPSFVRLELAAPELAEVGLAGDGLDGDGEDLWWDQRFKLVVPDAGGGLTSVEDADETWLSTWLERPAAERGHMRTYTVRALTGQGADRRLVVDVVLHEGASGPGADWAAAARVGHRAVVLLPRRGHPFGGIEFLPPVGSRLLLAGDETAVPAICAILEQLPLNACGAAYLEVPVAGDILEVRGPVGVEVTWLVRGGAEHGAALAAAVTGHLDAGAVDVLDQQDLAGPEPAEGEADIWETPTYSSSGEELTAGPADDDLYAWIAGESGVVTGLRRHLVRECGIDRSRVAFMGYWRRGVAMRS